MIKPNNGRQTAIRDPAVDDLEPDKLELYGVDRNGPVPPEETSQVEVLPPTCRISHGNFLSL